MQIRIAFTVHIMQMVYLRRHNPEFQLNWQPFWLPLKGLNWFNIYFHNLCFILFFEWLLNCVHLWQIINHIFCSADGHYEVTLMTKATVYNTGLVVWQPPAVYKSSCSIDVEYFPYDVQTCVLKLGSWTYDGFKVPYLNCNSNMYMYIYFLLILIILTRIRMFEDK